MARLIITNTVSIPEHELEISTSRAGGPGGQHVNKTSSRITLYWNLLNTQALTQEEKNRVLKALESRLTTDGYIIVNNSTTRSQLENKRRALEQLATLIRKALFIPKKRTATKKSAGAQEARLRKKAVRSEVKKMRSKKIDRE